MGRLCGQAVLLQAYGIPILLGGAHCPGLYRCRVDGLGGTVLLCRLVVHAVGTRSASPVESSGELCIPTLVWHVSFRPLILVIHRCTVLLEIDLQPTEDINNRHLRAARADASHQQDSKRFGGVDDEYYSHF
jgi:hypothetical protein